jgi:MoaA/NifB/PqqE/SkfB family radical SAM enzyme
LKRPLDVLSFITGVSPSIRPFFVLFEVTYRCDFRCGFCNIWKCGLYPNEASTEEFKTRLWESWELGCRLVSITGGEPLLRSDIVELVEYSLDLGFYVQLVTNGTLLDRHLDSLKGLDFLAVSFTFDENAYNGSRGVRAFRKVRDNIVKAADAGLKPSIFCVLTDETLDHAGETVNFAKELGIEVHFNSVDISPKEGYDDIDWNAVRAEDEKVLKTMRELKSYSGVKFNETLLRMNANGGFNEHVGCKAAQTVVSLKPDASVSLPCLIYTVASSGGSSLKAFWKSNAVASIRSKCGHFEFCKWCQLGCMYAPSLIGRPLHIFKWLNNMAY